MKKKLTPKQFKIQLAKIKQLAKAGKILPAPADKLSTLGPYIRKVVIAVEKALGISGVFCTDGSLLSDFSVDEEDLAKIGQALGIVVKRDDYLWEVAERLKKSEAGSR